MIHKEDGDKGSRASLGSDNCSRVIGILTEAADWLREQNSDLHPEETVATVAFSSGGNSKVYHLTWREIAAIRAALSGDGPQSSNA